MSSLRINRVFTRSGDGGSTSLANSQRLLKSHPRVCALGDVDELNSWLGLVREALSEKTESLAPILLDLQQQLFDLGAGLASPGVLLSAEKLAEDRLLELERLCLEFKANLPDLESFVLPGGSLLASYLHLSRVVARRAERSVVALTTELATPECSDAIKYLNRLSDLLFILARWSLAQEGKGEVLWKR